ncbi:MAG: FAD-dependent oxidoreductase [Candidatus Micrarchaeaceae archaeon]
MKNVDVLIVGGGVTGSSLLFLLSRYTNIKKVALIEKYDSLASLNSNRNNNAQTLHLGEIETNYTYEKAKATRDASKLIIGFNNTFLRKRDRNVLKTCQELVLAIGDKEIEQLRDYFDTVEDLFPKLRVIGKNEISKREPKTMEGRNPKEKVEAIMPKQGYMVDFGLLTYYFASLASAYNKEAEVFLNTRLDMIKRKDSLFECLTNKGLIKAKFVVFAAGTYSLFFAKKMNYGKNLEIFSVGGNFYISKRFLRGKVYRVQLRGIPFAAIHADPDIRDPTITRFGPTVNSPLLLERKHYDTFLDYLSTFDLDIDTLKSIKNILGDRRISRILAKNIGYGIPLLGKYLFLKLEAGRIVPTLKYSDLKFDRKLGGIRPQIINKEKHSLSLGESKLSYDGIIFNITPSPGASSCIYGAYEDSKRICEYLNKEFDEKKFESEIEKPSQY